jgi:hypothetical protein
MPLPPGLYVKSIRDGGQDLTKSLLDLTSGGAGSIDIVLSYNVADISGVLHGPDGQPVTGAPLTLWTPGTPSGDDVDFTPHDPVSERRNIQTYRSSAGRLSRGGLGADRPGARYGPRVPVAVREQREAASASLR